MLRTRMTIACAARRCGWADYPARRNSRLASAGLLARGASIGLEMAEGLSW